jgi:hypothetical protein
MARGRMVSKALSTSQKYARLTDVAGKRAEFCQAMYPLLVAHADDFGRLAGDPFTVKHAVVPTSPRKEPDVEAALTALHQVGLIVWYEADGRKCIQIVDFERHQSGLHKRTGSEFPDASGNFREIPSEGKRREGNRTEEKGTEGKGGANAPVVPLAEVPSDDDPAAPECKVEAVVQLWNEIATGTKLPQCRGLSEQRRKHIRARMKEHGLGVLRDVFVRVAESKFCNGDNDRRWVMTFDWLVASNDHVLRVLEGKYDNRQSPPEELTPWERNLPDWVKRVRANKANGGAQ